MQFIKSDINIDFLGKRMLAFYISLAVLIISIGSLVLHGGPKLGIDFAGGALIQVHFDKSVTIDDIHKGLNNAGINKPTVQEFGEEGANDYLIRISQTENTEDDYINKIISELTKSTGAAIDKDKFGSDMVGPQVGEDLREKALMAMLFSLLFITIYISGRFELKWGLSGVIAGALMFATYVLSTFNISIPVLTLVALIVSLILFWKLKLKYAMGAIVALIHDVTITVGIFSLLGKEFTLPIIAALLTIIGYSLNDTIIVFDRIRENRKRYEKKPLSFIINRSINETLSRTILTSLTTLAVVLCLYFFGGGIINNFAFALIIGVMIGTYSSIFVASPILLAWQDPTDQE